MFPFPPYVLPGPRMLSFFTAFLGLFTYPSCPYQQAPPSLPHSASDVLSGSGTLFSPQHNGPNPEQYLPQLSRCQDRLLGRTHTNTHRHRHTRADVASSKQFPDENPSPLLISDLPTLGLHKRYYYWIQRKPQEPGGLQHREHWSPTIG